MPMNMPDLALPVTSELYLPCVYGTTVVCSFSFFNVMLPVVWARASASIQMANIFCRPQNHDYNMAINIIIVIMSYTCVALGHSVVSFLAAICLFVCLFVCFLRTHRVRAAIDGDTRCSYNRSHAVQQTNLQLHIRIVAWTCRSYILCSYSSLLV